MADPGHGPFTTREAGVYSEVGRLRSVVMHRPDLAHERLTPANHRDLLFADVMWVRRARQEFDAVVELLQAHGVEVLLLHDLLTETLEDPVAREWLLSRRLRPEEVTAVLSRELAAWLSELSARDLANRLTGGVSARELPPEVARAAPRAPHAADFVLAPLPNQLFTRDACTWIDGGVALSTMRSPVRRKEALNVEAVCRHHPRFRAGTTVWFGGAGHDWGEATLEGGDVMAAGEGVVIVAESRRTSTAAASLLARNLLVARAARVVIGARLPRPFDGERLDALLAFCDRDVVAIREPAVSAVVPVRYLPDADGGVTAEVSERSLLEELRDELGLADLAVIDAAADVVAIAPGIVLADERDEITNHRLADAGVEVHAVAAQELHRGRGDSRRMTCPVVREA